MSISRSCALFIALLACAGTARAQSRNPVPEPCNRRGNNAQMSACMAQDLERADQELNRVYTDLIRWTKKESANREAELRAAERAWITYRDAQCAYEASYAEGGSLSPQLDMLCRKTLTEERTAQLRRELKGYLDR